MRVFSKGITSALLGTKLDHYQFHFGPSLWLIAAYLLLGSAYAQEYSLLYKDLDIPTLNGRVVTMDIDGDQRVELVSQNFRDKLLRIQEVSSGIPDTISVLPTTTLLPLPTSMNNLYVPQQYNILGVTSLRVQSAVAFDGEGSGKRNYLALYVVYPDNPSNSSINSTYQKSLLVFRMLASGAALVPIATPTVTNTSASGLSPNERGTLVSIRSEVDAKERLALIDHLNNSFKVFEFSSTGGFELIGGPRPLLTNPTTLSTIDRSFTVKHEGSAQRSGIVSVKYGAPVPGSNDGQDILVAITHTGSPTFSIYDGVRVDTYYSREPSIRRTQTLPLKTSGNGSNFTLDAAYVESEWVCQSGFGQLLCTFSNGKLKKGSFDTTGYPITELILRSGDSCPSILTASQKTQNQCMPSTSSMLAVGSETLLMRQDSNSIETTLELNIPTGTIIQSEVPVNTVSFVNPQNQIENIADGVWLVKQADQMPTGLWRLFSQRASSIRNMSSDTAENFHLQSERGLRLSVRDQTGNELSTVRLGQTITLQASLLPGYSTGQLYFLINPAHPAEAAATLRNWSPIGNNTPLFNAWSPFGETLVLPGIPVNGGNEFTLEIPLASVPAIAGMDYFAIQAVTTTGLSSSTTFLALGRP